MIRLTIIHTNAEGTPEFPAKRAVRYYPDLDRMTESEVKGEVQKVLDQDKSRKLVSWIKDVIRGKEAEVIMDLIKERKENAYRTEA